jgi:hypothetical protein
MPAEESDAFFRRQLSNCIGHGQYYGVEDPIADWSHLTSPLCLLFSDF